MLVVIISCTAPLTACGPYDANAQVGVTVDDAGNPVLVLQDCSGSIDTLDVAVPHVPGSGQPAPEVRLTIKKPVKGVVQIPLYVGGGGWTPVEAIQPFTAAGDYYVSSRGHRPDSRGGGVIFSIADLKPLKPGQIRHHIPPPAGVTYPTARFVSSDFYWVTPVEDFAPERCPKKK